MSADGLDAGQRAAVERRRNAVVSAGAGSGKTRVVAARFAALVAEGIDPAEILVLTFTRKAAAELAQRIHAEMAGSGADGATMGRLADATIGTIDSFCRSIASAAAPRWGYPPDFAVLEERSIGAIADAEALRFLLARAGDPAFGRLLAEYGFKRLWKDFLAEAALRYFHPSRAAEFAAAAEGQLAEAGRLFGRAKAGLEEAVARAGALDDGGLNYCVEMKKALAARAAEISSGAYDPVPGDEASFVRFARWLDGFAFRVPTGKKGDAAILNELGHRIKDELVPEARSLASTLASASLIRQAAALADAFAPGYLEARAAAGGLGFLETAEMAVDALREDRSLRRHFKAKFRAIMIDEFQDDNELQRELLYLLAERRGGEGEGVPGPEGLEADKLLFVGDAKQSIYRFRGADVSVFKALARDLGGEDASLRLGVNYRSSRGLVAFFNGLFPTVFDAAGSGADYEASFEPLAAGDEGGGPEPLIELWLAEKAGDVAGERAEAGRIAAFIDESVRSGNLPVRTTQGARPAGYGDFAVLFRARGKQGLVEGALKARGIPYSVEDAKAVPEEAVFSDALAYFSILHDPQDAAAFAQVLRSPFARLSVDFVAGLLAASPAPRAFDPLPAGFLPDAAERGKYGTAAALFAGLREAARSEPLATLAARLWMEGGYREVLMADPASAPWLDHYASVIAVARAAEGEGLAGLVDRMRDLAEGARGGEGEAPEGPRAGVRLMTVHKSKGLEFPVVIVPDCGSTARGRPGKPFFHHSREWGPCVNAKDEAAGNRAREGNHFAAMAEAEERARDAAELKRLLYVAATRAESHLVFSATVGRNKDGAIRGLGKADAEGPPASFLSLLHPWFEANRMGSIRTVQGGAIQGAAGAVGDAGKRGAAEADAAYAAAVPLARVSPRRDFAAVELNAEEAPHAGKGRPLPALPAIDAAVDEGRAGANAFGTLCHLLIQRGLEGTDPGEPLPEELSRALAGAPAAALGEAGAIARSFLASEAGKAAAAAPWRECELPFLLDAGEGFVSGQVDLAYGDGKTCRVLDFKTDREARPERYAAQLAAYAAAMEALFGVPCEARLCWLRDLSVEAAQPVDIAGRILMVTGRGAR